MARVRTEFVQHRDAFLACLDGAFKAGIQPEVLQKECEEIFAQMVQSYPEPVRFLWATKEFSAFADLLFKRGIDVRILVPGGNA